MPRTCKDPRALPRSRAALARLARGVGSGSALHHASAALDDRADLGRAALLILLVLLPLSILAPRRHRETRRARFWSIILIAHRQLLQPRVGAAADRRLLSPGESEAAFGRRDLCARARRSGLPTFWSSRCGIGNSTATARTPRARQRRNRIRECRFSLSADADDDRQRQQRERASTRCGSRSSSTTSTLRSRTRPRSARPTSCR